MLFFLTVFIICFILYTGSKVQYDLFMFLKEVSSSSPRLHVHCKNRNKLFWATL